jgi:hypothetical protein
MTEYSPTLSLIFPRSSSIYFFSIRFILISSIILSSWAACHPLQGGEAAASTIKESSTIKTTIAHTPHHPLTPSLSGPQQSLYIDLGYSNNSFSTTKRYKNFSPDF